MLFYLLSLKIKTYSIFDTWFDKIRYSVFVFMKYIESK